MNEICLNLNTWATLFLSTMGLAFIVVIIAGLLSDILGEEEED